MSGNASESTARPIRRVRHFFAEHSVAIVSVYVPALIAVAIHAITVATEPLNYDEAFNLQVSLNAALGNGYQTWYGRAKPFDPLITTGPTVLLPAAAALRVFPRTAVTGRLVMTLYFVGFLIAVYRIGSLLVPDGRRLFFLSSVVFLFTIPTFDRNSAWVLGEIPAITFYLFSLPLLVTDDAHPRDWLLAGVLFGLASLTKLNILLCVAIPIATIALVEWRRGVMMIARGIACFVAGAALPPLAWHGYKIAVLGWAGYQALIMESVAFVRSHGSGANNPLGAISMRVPAHLKVLSGVFVSSPPLIGGALVALALFAAAVWFRHGRPPLAFALVTSGVALIVWWLAVSDWYFYRHAIPGYIFLALTCAYVVTVATVQFRRSTGTDRAVLVLAAVSAYLLLPVVAGTLKALNRIRVPSPPLLTAQRESEQNLAVVVRQIKQSQPTATFWGYGHYQTPEISYLTAIPFRDITTEDPAPDDRNYLVIGPHFGAKELDTYATSVCQTEVYHQTLFRLCRIRSVPPVRRSAPTYRIGDQPGVNWWPNR